jgi:hypothetical protein
MSQYEIIFNPGYQVILEGALDNLVKYIGGNDLVDICPGEFGSERLECNQHRVEAHHAAGTRTRTLTSAMIPYWNHSVPESTAFTRAVVSSCDRRSPPTSRSSHRAVQLHATCQNVPSTMRGDIPGAPSLNHTGQEGLFRVVCDVGS